MTATGNTWTSEPDLTRDDIRAAIVADTPRRAYALALQTGADRAPWRFRWRIGIGTARALVMAHEVALHPPGSSYVREPGPLPGRAQMLGSDCEVVHDLPLGHLELHEVDRDLLRQPYGTVAGDVLDVPGDIVAGDTHTYRVRVDSDEGGRVSMTTLAVDGVPVEPPGPITRAQLEAAVVKAGPIYTTDLAVDALVELLAARGIHVVP